MIGSRAAAAAEEVAGLAPGAVVEGALNEETAARADVVFIAVPYSAQRPTISFGLPYEPEDSQYGKYRLPYLSQAFLTKMNGVGGRSCPSDSLLLCGERTRPVIPNPSTSCSVDCRSGRRVSVSTVWIDSKTNALLLTL